MFYKNYCIIFLISWFLHAFIDANAKNKVVFSLNYYLGQMKIKDKFWVSKRYIKFSEKFRFTDPIGLKINKLNQPLVFS